ncbi:hypothetical protein [Streptomyces collinus]|uniref:hypothetical protein n=1 Tax=Streptomyces collinus TaxID=42684 RepID=UPI0036E394C0
MTLPAAPFGTAVRVLRTAAGRRTLQLVLVVGGLFVLSFLCGEQAHAAEGAPTAVTGQVISPVRDVARTASGALERTQAEVSALPPPPAVPPAHLPTLPPAPTVHLPAVPQLPATQLPPLPHLPAVQLPALPHLPALPGTRLPALPRLPAPPGTPEPAPGSPSPSLPQDPGGSGPSARSERPARPAADAPAASASRSARNGGTAAAAGPAHRVRGEARAAASGARPSATAYGPHAAGAAHVSAAPARAAARPAAAPLALFAGTPAPPRPTGDPDGVLGKQVADAPAPRHGDGRAVAPDARAPLRLVPAGTVVRADAPRTRERHRDVLVAPG